MSSNVRETPQALAKRIIGHHVDETVKRSRLTRKAITRHGPNLTSADRVRIVDYLKRDHALTLSRLEQVTEIEPFDFPPSLDDGL